MRMLVKFQMPIEPFNSMVRDGTVGEVLGRILDDLKPEAVYFTGEDGYRGGTMVINMKDTSEIPRYAEPFFLNFKAKVEFIPCMLPEDLMKAGLDELGKKWG